MRRPREKSFTNKNIIDVELRWAVKSLCFYVIRRYWDLGNISIHLIRTIAINIWVLLEFSFFFFFFFPASLAAYGSSRVRDWIQSAAQPKLQPWQCWILNPLHHGGNSWNFTFMNLIMDAFRIVLFFPLAWYHSKSWSLSKIKRRLILPSKNMEERSHPQICCV